MLRWISALILLTTFQVQASTKFLHIGLFHGEEPAEVIVQPGDGSYTVYGNGQKLYDLGPKTILRIKNLNGLISVKTLGEDLGSFGVVEVKRDKWGSSLVVQRADNVKRQHEYFDDFTIKPHSGKLRIINDVYIEHYVAGVVESEAGSKEPKEYYKVQAVICRTYALNNRRRHEAEGFQLCDKVHCQVYHRRSKANPDIIRATLETTGIVIVDSDINLVTAAFHSNCGGYTCNSEDVWSGYLEYLRGRTDDNCSQEPHSYWRYTTTTDQWLEYLRTKHGYPIHDPIARNAILNYCPDKRQISFDHNADGIDKIDFKHVRHDLKLRSAYFSVDQVQDSIIIEGKGYGHGVGLCQEGAMNMAKRGVSYDEILHYYYNNIHLVNLSVIDFFRSE
ncbi:MAG: SpoIID/LytB domain-containing protein [Flavobacteriales bacterium]